MEIQGISPIHSSAINIDRVNQNEFRNIEIKKFIAKANQTNSKSEKKNYYIAAGSLGSVDAICSLIKLLFTMKDNDDCKESIIKTKNSIKEAKKQYLFAIKNFKKENYSQDETNKLKALFEELFNAILSFDPQDIHEMNQYKDANEFAKKCHQLDSDESIYIQKIANYYFEKSEFKKFVKWSKLGVNINDSQSMRELFNYYIKRNNSNKFDNKINELYKNQCFIKSDEDKIKYAKFLYYNYYNNEPRKTLEDVEETLYGCDHEDAILLFIQLYLNEKDKDKISFYYNKYKNNSSYKLKHALAEALLSFKADEQFKEYGLGILRENLNYNDSSLLYEKYDNEYKQIKENESNIKKEKLERERILNEVIKHLSCKIMANNQNYLSFNDKCHRFINILCPTKTLVNNNLHANTVDVENLHFIASQYPLENQIETFLTLIHEHQNLIVNLTDENDISQTNLIEYLPSSLKINDQFEIKKLNQKEKNNSTINIDTYKSVLNNVENEFKYLKFNQWNDNKCLDFDLMTQLVQKILSFKTSENRRVIIHCVAGSGRTMTLIAGCAIYKKIEELKTSPEYVEIIDDKTKPIKIGSLLLPIVKSCRESRGNHAIKNFQIEFLLHWAMSLI